MGNKACTAEIRSAEAGRLDLLIDGRPIVAYVSTEGPRTWVTAGGQTLVLAKSSGARRGAGIQSPGSLAAPMPGQVRAVNVQAGEAVTRGQTLLIIEAMKMEIRIQAPKDGIVSRLLVKPGQTVEREQILITVD
jgi:biotin carboxyl carrier protein